MSISKSNLERLDKLYQFNMVNYDNEEFKKLGLKPLYFTAYPSYINLSGNVFYSGPLNSGPFHFQCNLVNDIKEILKIMNSNVYDRFEDVFGFLNDDYPLRFSIYNNQIFFSDMMTLSVYKNNLGIREEINKKFNIKEILGDYDFEYLKKHYKELGNKLEYYHLNLTPQEYFALMISSKKKELSPFINANELNAHDIKNWLNYNANIFMEHKCSWDTTGVYNEETMRYINNLKETKLDIYNFFNNFSKQAKDWQKAIKELLTILCVYHEFIPKEIDNDNPFCDDSVYAERSYWDKMFAKASYDILANFVGFDKIETKYPKTITTTKPNIYEEFFNPLVMGYNIVQMPKLIFDEEKQCFRWIFVNEFINSGINRECEKEIKLIKKYIPEEERYLYLRNY